MQIIHIISPTISWLFDIRLDSKTWLRFSKFNSNLLAFGNLNWFQPARISEYPSSEQYSISRLRRRLALKFRAVREKWDTVDLGRRMGWRSGAFITDVWILSDSILKQSTRALPWNMPGVPGVWGLWNTPHSNWGSGPLPRNVLKNLNKNGLF